MTGKDKPHIKKADEGKPSSPSLNKVSGNSTSLGNLYQSPKIAVVSLQRFDRVSRLSRLISYFREQNLETHLISFAENPENVSLLPQGPGSNIILPFKVTKVDRWVNRAMRFAKGLAARLPGGLWRIFDRFQHGYVQIQKAVQNSTELSDRFDFIICHTYAALPLAFWIKEQFGGKIVYDVTELFSEQYSYHPVWKFLERPHVICVEAYYGGKADLLISPCEGYLAYSANFYGWTQKRAVIRNTMEAANSIFLETDYGDAGDDSVGQLTLIYQGLALPNRGLEIYIRSTQHWPEGCRLVLQCVGDDGYIDHLKHIAIQLDVKDRLLFIPPVNATAREMIRSLKLHGADLGLCCFDPALLQLRLSEPNKLFTYLSAGVGVIAVDQTASARLINEQNAGAIISQFDEYILAAKVCELANNAQQVSRLKENAKMAAKEWSWEKEKKRLGCFLGIEQ